MSRVRNATLLDEHYDSKGFKAEEYFKDGIGVLGKGEPQLVELLISEPMASYVSERRWHDSQKIVRNPQGIVFTMTVRVNDELARWVMGLGDSAVVVTPLELAEKIKKQALAISKKYKKAA